MSGSVSDSWGKHTTSATPDGPKVGAGFADNKDATVAEPEAVTPDQGSNDQADTEANTPEPGETVTTPKGESDQEGVQVGGLTYTQNDDGTRSYEGQEKVETTGDPTPTPEA